MAAAAVDADALGSMEDITDVDTVDATGARSTKPEPARVRTDTPLRLRKIYIWLDRKLKDHPLTSKLSRLGS